MAKQKQTPPSTNTSKVTTTDNFDQGGVDSLIEFEVFIGGDRLDSRGNPTRLAEAELDQIVESYNPASFRAPIIVSHNTNGVPDNEIVESELAFGEVFSLRRVGNRLKAACKRIAPKLVNWIQDGQILDRSISVYRPHSAHNPTPGKWHLRHVAMLGKSAPAVKGQEPLSKGFEPLMLSEFFAFEEDGEEVDTAEFWCHCSPIPDALSQVREHLIESQGREAADKTVSAAMVKAAHADAERTSKLFGEVMRLRAELREVAEEVKNLAQDADYEDGSHQIDGGDNHAEMMGSLRSLHSQFAELQDQLDAYHNSVQESDDEIPPTEDLPSPDFGEDGIDMGDDIPTPGDDSMDENLQVIDDQKTQIEYQEQQIEDLQSQIQAFQEQAEALQAERRKEAVQYFVSGLNLPEAVTSPRTLNFMGGESGEMDLVSFMTALGEDELVFFKDLLTGLVQIAETPSPSFEEEAGTPDTYTPPSVNMMLPDGVGVDPESLKFHEMAIAYQDAHNCDYDVAFTAVGAQA